MLSQEQVLKGFLQRNRGVFCSFDPWDAARLGSFFDVSEWEKLGLWLREGQSWDEPKREWTREEVLEQVRCDVSFGFEKALGKRGISARLMNEVVQMWLWVLEIDFLPVSYAQYGLPLLKKVSLAFGFDNPIGDDTGSEEKYA